MPSDGTPVRIQVAGVSLVLGSESYAAPVAKRPAKTLDPLSYGSAAPVRFDPYHPDRRFRYDVGRRPGFLDGKPGMWWTVNGRMFPDVPMFMVSEGDVVRIRIANHSGEAHPMHLHGHHALVLSRDGERATGSPWWTDSLEVGNGETYDIAFRADNPGIWMDHCHT
ncbi:MAG: multicopper oxidase domain-containing protein, partial [Micromonosporaceae bacterium]